MPVCLTLLLGARVHRGWEQVAEKADWFTDLRHRESGRKSKGANTVLEDDPLLQQQFPISQPSLLKVSLLPNRAIGWEPSLGYMSLWGHLRSKYNIQSSSTAQGCCRDETRQGCGAPNRLESGNINPLEVREVKALHTRGASQLPPFPPIPVGEAQWSTLTATALSAWL